MKNKILPFIILFSSYSSLAQFKIGFTAGAQLCNMRISTYNTDNRFAFNLGAAGIVDLTQDIDLHFQLLLSSKGYKYYDDFSYKHVLKPIYIQLPVVARFKFKTTEDVDINLGAGGFYAIGIGGKQTYYEYGVKESQKIKFGDGEDKLFRRSDYGMEFQFGAAFHENFEGHFFYDLGLANIYPGSTTNSFSRVFGFNLGWYFDLNKE